jgi:cytochrome c-type biogenesis protein CcmF
LRSRPPADSLHRLCRVLRRLRVRLRDAARSRLDAAWARWTRPWTLAAWLFLTIGIALGSWWAYYELGWGGWWFWDPVENASFMPWLAGTALIHSLAVTEKRGLFKSWTLAASVAAFSLSLLGTFLVRSGVLISVHAFATTRSAASSS